MKEFVWKNKYTCGKILAHDIHHAKFLLIQRNIEWQKINRSFLTCFALNKKQSINKKIIFQFLQELHTLLKANITLLQTIKIIKANANSAAFINLLATLEKEIYLGKSLSSIFNQFPNYFDKITCTLIQTGEITGRMDTTLALLIRQKQKIITLKNQLKKAAFYPLFLLASTLGITFFLLEIVIPQFADLYQSFGAKLPTLTTGLLKISIGFRQRSDALLLCFSLIFLVIFWLVKKHPRIKKFFGMRLVRLPILGKFLHLTHFVHFLQLFYLFFEAGIPILDIFKLIRSIHTAPIFQQVCCQLETNIKKGMSLYESMHFISQIPDFAKNLIRLGEETGTLSEMLNQSIIFHENKIDQYLNYFQLLFEPLILILLSGMIGIVLVALYLPVFNMGTMI